MNALAQIDRLLAVRRARLERARVRCEAARRDCAVQAEVTRFWRVDQAGGIVGAHLEDHAHFEFAQRLAAEEAVHVVERVDRREDVHPVAAAFLDEVIEHGARFRAGVGAAHAEVEVVLVSQLLELL